MDMFYKVFAVGGPEVLEQRVAAWLRNVGEITIISSSFVTCPSPRTNEGVLYSQSFVYTRDTKKE